jgi:hypothetical protein
MKTGGTMLAVNLAIAIILVGSGAPRTLAQPAGAGEGTRSAAGSRPPTSPNIAACQSELERSTDNSQCQLNGKSASPALIKVQIVRGSDWEDPHPADGYKRVRGRLTRVRERR